MNAQQAAVLTVHQASAPLLIQDGMTVMSAAFDPRYGEAWTADQLRSMLDLPGSRFIAARLGDRMAGFGLIRAIAGEAELLLLAVAPDVRRCGVGRAILERCVRTAQEDGARIMFLEVREDNDAIGLYAAARFEQYNSRRDYYLGADGRRRSALSFRRVIDTRST